LVLYLIRVRFIFIMPSLGLLGELIAVRSPRRSRAKEGFGRKEIFFDGILRRFPFVLSVTRRMTRPEKTERQDAGT
jgi:hypothetical protein